MATDDSEGPLRDRRHWTGQAVSWGNLMISAVGLLVALAGIAVVVERRLTTVEEKQNTLVRESTAKTEEIAEIRRLLYGKLDKIQSDMTDIKIELVRKNPEAFPLRR